MDLEEQGRIRELAERHGGDALVVVLGSPDAESARVYAETVTKGDPAWAGPLAGVSLKLPVYHILDDEIKREVDPQVYQDQVGLMEMALDREAIVNAVAAVRNG
jgi:glycine reductase